MNLSRLFKGRMLGVWLLLAAMLAGSVYWAGHRAPALVVRFKTETLKIGDVAQTVSANGTLNPVVLVNVGTQVSGTVKALRADFNDRVQQGQVLAELDPALLQAQVHQTEASVANVESALALAKINEQRLRTLIAQDSAARQDYDQALQALQSARAQLRQLRAQLSKDKTNLAYATIRSPVSGVVVDRQVDMGQTVAASFQTPTLFRIAQDLRQMQIDSSFAEADIGNIKVGQAVRFHVDAFSDRNFVGQVRQIRLNPTVQQNVVTYDVVVAVDNPEEILMPGMTAYVSIDVAQRRQVLLAPNAALRFRPPADAPVAATARRQLKRGATSAVVYVLERKQLKPVTVTTGIADSHFTEIVGGDLRAGDGVVIEDQLVAAPSSNGTLHTRMF